MRTPNIGLDRERGHNNVGNDKRYAETKAYDDRINARGLDIDQIYVQLARDGFCLYSYPPAPNLPQKWADTIDGYLIGDLSHYEIYRKAFRKR